MYRHTLARATAAVLLTGVVSVTAPPTGAHAQPAAGTSARAATSATSVSSGHGKRTYPRWGRLVSHDHVLRAGRHKYRYHYVIDPPTPYWSAELFLVDPHGIGLASNALDANSDPGRGNLSWTLHRASTPHGRYKLKMKITFCRDKACTGDKREGYVKPHYFRMLRRR